MRKLWKNKIPCAIAAVLMISSLAGCGSSGEGTTAGGDTGEATAAVTEAVTETETETEAVTEAVTTEDPWKDAVDSVITVKKLEVPESFYKGADVSSYDSEIAAGVTYYDYEGNALDGPGFFGLLKSCGFNAIRLRVWNDPYDSEGHTYGGGACDLAAAIRTGKLASDAGLRVLIDFHYSDFWADPGRQLAPKAWEGMSGAEKQEAIYAYTKDSLTELKNAGVNVTMVQIGNETTRGMSGESDWNVIVPIMQSASKAIREVLPEADVAVHFTNPENGNFASFAETLKDLDYDIFATSYYPYWHGGLWDLTQQLKALSENYGKKVMVAETSYIHTFIEGDGQGNTEGYGKAGDVFGYDVSEQGQADLIRGVAGAIADVGEAGVGVFYWEPAWIPVNPIVSKEDYEAGVIDYQPDTEAYKANQEAWEKFGCGWASSYAGSYDEVSLTGYGGSAVDNEALFDFWGKPLESLKTFKYMETGAYAPKKALRAENLEMTVELGEKPDLPKKIRVFYNDGDIRMTDTTWDDSGVDVNTPGTYTISGKALALEDVEMPSIITLTVNPANILPNPGFEDEDMSMWNISAELISRKDDSSNVRTGKYCLHFWDSGEVAYSVEQKITLDAGTYTCGAWVEGGDVGDDAEIEMYILVGEEKLTAKVTLAGWKVWQNPEIKGFTVAEAGTEVTVGISCKAAPGGWGAWDDFYLYPEN